MFPHYPFWVIQDSQAREKYNFGSIPAGRELPAGFAARAETLAKLAEEIGVDPDGLEDEIGRFNGYVDQGVDPDFHRGEKAWSNHNSGDHAYPGNPNLGKLDKGPFYAVRLYPVTVGCPVSGWRPMSTAG